MSVLGKKWIVKKKGTIDDILQVLLENRAISDQANFLEPDFSEHVHDPYLLKDMELAVTRIREARSQNNRILVVGDYDMDGISSTALLCDFLKNRLGLDVSYRIPNRLTEGYGLNQDIVDEAIQDGINLLITVDNGISCYDEVQNLKEAGIDTIITDHHAIPEKLPAAIAILHTLLSPNYPFKELSGVGVAYKFLQALAKEFLSEAEAESASKWALDLVALGTVADCMVLTGENRMLTKYGLIVLEKTKRQGLQILMELGGQKGRDVNTETISFCVAPRLNAAGRLKDASLAVDLLLTQDAAKALQLAQEAEELNSQRQKITEELCALAEEKIRDLGDKKIIIVSDQNFHAGIVGLVASRLTEKYELPSVILEEGEDGVMTASCRSPEGFDMIEAISSQAELLERFGGHSQAAGFTIQASNFPQLKEALEKLAAEELAEKDLRAVIKIDAVLPEELLQEDVVQEINKLEPFGIGNPKPIFLLENVEILRVSSVGTEGRHLKLNMRKGRKYLDGIGFKLGDLAMSLGPGMRAALVGHFEVNHWNGNTKLQLQLLDLKPLD